jgi:acetyl esterase
VGHHRAQRGPRDALSRDSLAAFLAEIGPRWKLDIRSHSQAVKDASALVLISARLRADRLAVNPNAEAVAAYFGADAALDEIRSPASHVAQSEMPTLVAIAEHENPLLDVYGLEFAHRLAAARGHAPRVLQLAGHNHMSMVAHFDSGEDLLGREVVAFFEGVRDAR